VRVEIRRSTTIGRPIREVFDFVADARHDPRWCPKVESVEHVAGECTGPGARYAVVHRPIPLRPARRLDHRCVGWSPPRRIEWLEDDGTDRFEVTYELEGIDGDTHLTQTTSPTLGVTRLLHPVLRLGIGADVARQLRALKRLLESGA
jgi:uncharacterized protein YndB with AHSA1/START domain